jgi:hypothetical protein
MHFIKATDLADRDRQIAELLVSGKVGPRDGLKTTEAIRVSLT